MRLLIDMNLPPAWVSHFAARGFEAVHWSTIGAPTAVVSTSWLGPARRASSF